MVSINVDYDHKPDLIEKLNNQESLVNLNIKEVQVERNLGNKITETRYVVEYQVRVKGNVNKGTVVNAMVESKFRLDEREAAIRKGIMNIDDQDYQVFYKFVENCKLICIENGIQ